jgi:hypothetical protein
LNHVFRDLPELPPAALMEDPGERGLFRAEWKPEYVEVVGAVAESGVTVLAASGTSDGWVFEVRAEERTQVSTVRVYCDAAAIDVALAHITRLSAVSVRHPQALSARLRR